VAGRSGVGASAHRRIGLPVAGVVCALVWLIIWPFHRIFAGPTVGSRG
jgi:hypothetical protein